MVPDVLQRVVLFHAMPVVVYLLIFVHVHSDAATPQVCGEGDGEHVHGGAEIVHQPAEIQPGEFTCLQRRHGLQVLAAKTQTL